MRENRYIETGKLIRNARLRKGISVKELSNKLRVSKNVIYEWEIGIYFPIHTVDDINRILGTEIEYPVFVCKNEQCGNKFVPEAMNMKFCSSACRGRYNSAKNEIRNLKKKNKDGYILFIYRTRLGLSQKALGESIGVVSQIISDWERGVLLISPKRKMEINEFFGKDIFDDYRRG